MSDNRTTAGIEAREADRLDLHAEPVGRGTTATVTVRRGGADGEVVASVALILASDDEE